MKKANDILAQHSKYIPGMGSVIPTIRANEAISNSYNCGIEACVKLLRENEIELGCETKSDLIVEKLNRLKINI